ncbi:MAG: TonB-dependent receptor [Bryobacteraceae bacterium]|nr:TonB-dependent receptor [Bryobacteraceae bacterium]
MRTQRPQHVHCPTRIKVAALWLLSASWLMAQGPDASLRGVVTDDAGKPLAGTEITVTQTATGLARRARADDRGEYLLIGLPRGLYHLRAELAGYQVAETAGIELRVGGRHEERIVLSRPSAADLEPGLPPAPSLPVETVASSVSVVVEENRILQLPLASRNIYSLFLLQPGVTSQGGIVRRGLSFSVHGQRVSGSNYRLDGVDNNNIVLTGPATPASAEAIQEFRMVNSSFSAENGRATAFVAQVVTRAGSNRFAGSLFEYFSHNNLNANTFQNNASGIQKPAFKRNQFGFSLTGPLHRNSTFFSGVLELSRFRFGGHASLMVPTPAYIESLPADSLAGLLLRRTPPLAPTAPTADPNVGLLDVQVPNRIDTTFVTGRLDHHFENGASRLGFRYTAALTGEQRAEYFNGYPDLFPKDDFQSQNVMVNWNRSFRGDFVNDFRAGWNRERIWLRRPFDFVPVLLEASNVSLPSTIRQTAERENNNVLQVSDTLSWRKGRSAVMMGFEYRRNISSGVSLGLETEALGGVARLPDGFYAFSGLDAFRQGVALAFFTAVDRTSRGALRRPDFYRKYRSNEFGLFVQNDIRLTPRLSLNLGLRYEYFGVPRSAGAGRDFNFYFGPGQTPEEKVITGGLRSTDDNPGDLKGRLYRRDFWNFAPSIGLAWDPFGSGRTILRAGYSLALDRVFDTLRDLRTNTIQVVGCPICDVDWAPFVIPVEAALPLLERNLAFQPPPDVIQLDENLRTPYAQNWYFGAQRTLTPDTVVEIGHAGSVGRKLISRDLLNRRPPWPLPSPNPAYGEITYLSNSGNSNYLALEASVRRRFARGFQFQASYTYSHAIDNQSDIFEGVRTGPWPYAPALAAFTRAFDPRIDRGNANFDQRQNLVFNAIWQLPGPRSTARWSRWLANGWTASVIGAYRTGFPLTAIETAGGSFRADGLWNNRLDVIGQPGRSPVAGGVQWLNPADFQPVQGRPGTLGRGGLPGPGFWNYDFALLKTFGLRERLRVQLRAEFYNLFNHANLAAPSTLYYGSFSLPNPEFGIARYGANPPFSRFGDLPLESSSRRIQLALRIEF